MQRPRRSRGAAARSRSAWGVSREGRPWVISVPASYPELFKITQFRFDPNHIRSWGRERGRVPRPTPPDDQVLARRRAVGDQIRRVRERHNLTQSDVCSRSGIDIASYSRIEQGHSSPKLDTLIRISDAIGVQLAELVE
ncbi:helix-turn-helix domain-containing protein [Streptomyces sp. NPDC006285]|uniref:helix-turn-helix domain-containing protein n=1 Tax=Streptomyces sp. NPDC006285 TaxID=3364742 RepID=UPI0036878999